MAVAAITAYVQFVARDMEKGQPAPESVTLTYGEPEMAGADGVAGAPEPTETPEEMVKPTTDHSSLTTHQAELTEAPEQVEKPRPQVVPGPAPELDKAAITAAEDGLDATSRDRARADNRAAESARRLSLATGQAALDASRARKLAFVVRDPSVQISQASARGGFIRGERDKLEKEITTLRQLPRPKSTSILSKSPVARPAAGNESHFELRHNRISYIDLDRLLELTKADAQVRIRMSDRTPAISNKVGPVGSFSLEYELIKSVPGSVEELLERKSLRYDLRAWEVVPEFESRGETYEATKNPISEFSRAINRINPDRGTITFWVYPDSFTLYRRLHDELVDRGFSVAARPLPEGMAIRGSPLGTQSAAQ
jgi:hypothetical protein